MMKRLIAIGFFLIAIAAGVEECRAQDQAKVLRDQLESALLSKTILGFEPLYRPSLVKSFYESTHYEPAWKNSVDVSMLLTTVQFAVNEGLNPEDYHLTSLRNYALHSESSLFDTVSIDIMLTDAFMHLGSHLLSGRVDPAMVYPGLWEADTRKADLVSLLQEALQKKSIVKTLDNLSPNYPHYKNLRLALQNFKSLSGKYDWPEIPSGLTLKPGMTDDRIVQIRKRLSITGQYIPDDFVNSAHYDSGLIPAVQKFQRDYGLEPDGIIGNRTLAVLNTLPDLFIQKIILNMERYRWLPDVPDGDYVFVNIPSFHLDMMWRDSVIMTMRTIVGRPDRKTPVFSSVLQYLILNPTWIVPPTILREDVLPAVKRNIGYLSKNRLRVINSKGEEVNPADLPWLSYTAQDFPYQLRQDPGPANSLGLIKFQFPSNHTVFLHDTNLPGLFSRNYRALSSGCIRVEHPFKLAAYLMRETSWNDEMISEMIRSGDTHTIILSEHVPIHINYFTVWFDQNNCIQFADDIYGWDEVLIKNLF